MLSFFFFRLAFSLAVFFLSSALSSLSFARFATGAGKSQTNTSLPLPRFSQSPIEQASRGGGSAKSTSCVSFHSPKTDSIVFPSDPRVSDLERGLPLSALSLHVVTTTLGCVGFRQSHEDWRNEWALYLNRCGNWDRSSRSLLVPQEDPLRGR